MENKPMVKTEERALMLKVSNHCFQTLSDAPQNCYFLIVRALIQKPKHNKVILINYLA